MHHFVILSFLVSYAGAVSDSSYISINCGGAAASTALTGRKWLQDAVTKGFSTASTVKGGEVITSVDPVPYKTARISRSRFLYSFLLNPGQKYIRLHFNPSSYNGFEGFNDFFTVEAGGFTLLANFSASITARALSVNTLIKEFCIIIPENEPLDIVFSPETSPLKINYAFINGIDIISVPSTISYCHGEDIGVQVLGLKYVIHVDNNTALERVHHVRVKWGPVSSGDDIGSMFGMWASNAKKVAYNKTWRVSVDVGFRYMVRVHLCELEQKMDFMILINNMTALTSADMLHQRGNQSFLWYKNYMLMVEGRKGDDKRKISISLHSHREFLDRHGPLEGFEVFKLSNHDRSLDSPNPLLPRGVLPSLIMQILFHLTDHMHIFVTVICLLNSLVWKANSTKEKSKPDKASSKQSCRIFSLAEIQSATQNFREASTLGKGGYGAVYKGLLDKERDIVAIKRSGIDSKLGKHQLGIEVEMLSKLRHVNLLSLIGYCTDHDMIFLVYEYMPLGTLADHLYRKSIHCRPLSWKQRLKISIGVGRALDYLHTGHGMMHCDLKASNILLDENYEPKISDFGIANLISDSQNSTIFVGSRLPYIDPNYFRTGKLTKESDIYSFGVLMLEILCGRRAVVPWNKEDKHSLTIWAVDKIRKGQVDDIVDPSLRGKISPESLKTFVKITARCLHDEPKKRPATVHAVIVLELALQQQEKTESLVPEKDNSDEDVFSSTDKENLNEMKSVTDHWLGKVPTILSPWPRLFMVSSGDVYVQQERYCSAMITSEYINATSFTTILERQRALRKTIDSLSKRLAILSLSAPIKSHRSRKMTLGGSALSDKSINPTLRYYSYKELMAATKDFSSDAIIGEGGFGKVYKGWIHDSPSAKKESGSIVAVKKLKHESMQGVTEWQSEVKILGKLSHPNLVKLLGYGWDGTVLFLVYEFMQNGSLENYLSGSYLDQALAWDIRLKILSGAARGLAFLHTPNVNVIHGDFKPSNVLLDGSFHAKISDFGLARACPEADSAHESTGVMGTYGYAAPEYIFTGRLSMKCDVYSFGVVLLEMVTGLRVLDSRRPTEQHNLVEWMKPRLSERRELKNIVDPRMEGRPSSESAAIIAHLALSCLQMNPKSRPTMQQVVNTMETMD